MLALANATIDDTAKPYGVDRRPVGPKADADGPPLTGNGPVLAGTLRLEQTRDGRSWNGRQRMAVYHPAERLRYRVGPSRVSYLATYFDLPKAGRRYPYVPPDIVVEVHSPGHSDVDVAAKRAYYAWWWGATLIITADPDRSTVQEHEADDITHLTATDVLTSRAFPKLTVDLRELFAELDEPEGR